MYHYNQKEQDGSDFRRDVFDRLGIPVNRLGMEFLFALAQSEGGHFKNDARYNLLNIKDTDRYGPGPREGKLVYPEQMGDTGITKYPTYQAGVNESAETLQQYPTMIRMLKGLSVSPADENAAVMAWKGQSSKGLKLYHDVKKDDPHGFWVSPVPASGASRHPDSLPQFAPPTTTQERKVYKQKRLNANKAAIAAAQRRLFSPAAQTTPTSYGKFSGQG